eukprot:6172914-Pleurochrysis_carterae.AAC.1
MPHDASLHGTGCEDADELDSRMRPTPQLPAADIKNYFIKGHVARRVESSSAKATLLQFKINILHDKTCHKHLACAQSLLHTCEIRSSLEKATSRKLSYHRFQRWGVSCSACAPRCLPAKKGSSSGAPAETGSSKYSARVLDECSFSTPTTGTVEDGAFAQGRRSEGVPAAWNVASRAARCILIAALEAENEVKERAARRQAIEDKEHHGEREPHCQKRCKATARHNPRICSRTQKDTYAEGNRAEGTHLRSGARFGRANRWVAARVRVCVIATAIVVLAAAAAVAALVDAAVVAAGALASLVGASTIAAFLTATVAAAIWFAATVIVAAAHLLASKFGTAMQQQARKHSGGEQVTSEKEKEDTPRRNKPDVCTSQAYAPQLLKALVAPTARAARAAYRRQVLSGGACESTHSAAKAWRAMRGFGGGR